ncbi:hypothetical protein ACEZDB_26840 [Streptacidiphilus sp. N1-3]|uniref:Integrase n=1 Tax=Streptacidiphilus alkalitolerans TaxID=3342712 RepID=A0ABV6X7U3_9ACTN
MPSYATTANRGMTRRELLELPASIPLDTGNRALGIGRSHGYDLAKQGEYPCKVLRLGNAWRVITADLLRVLAVQPDGSAEHA